MTSIRSLTSTEGKMITPRVILRGIEEVKQTLYEQTLKALLGDAKPPSLIDAQRVSVFELMWRYFAAVSADRFASIKEIDFFYKAYLEKITIYIEQYCLDANLDNAVVTPQTMQLFRAIVAVHAELSKMKFHHLKLNENENINDRMRDADILRQSYDQIHLIMEGVDSESLNANLVSFDALISCLLAKLQSKGYIKKEVLAVPIISAEESVDHPKLAYIQQQFEKLPDFHELSALVLGYQAAHEKGELGKARDYLLKLKDPVQALESVGRSLNETHLDLLKAKEKLEELLEKHQQVASGLDRAHPIYSLKEKFRGLIAIRGADDAELKRLSDVSKQYQDACVMQVSRVFKRSVTEAIWSLPAKTVKQSMVDISRQINLFTQPYEGFLHEIDELQEQFIAVRLRNNLLVRERKVLLDKMMIAEEMMLSSIELVSQSQMLFKRYTESYADYFKAFMRHHWKKVSVSTVGSGGAGALLSWGFFAMHPIPTAVVTTALTVIGAASGAGVGAVSDMIRDKRASALNAGEESMLSKLHLA